MSDDGRITCATYTHARRHPMVLGKIGDWSPPVQLTVVQLAVVVVTMVIEFQTWRWWAAPLPPGVAIFVFLVLPCVLAWVVRRARVEGRSLPRAMVGWLLYAVRSRAGQVGGRSARPAAPVGLGAYPVYVAAADAYPDEEES